MARPEQPFTSAEIRRALEEVEHGVRDFFASLPTEAFFHRPGDDWGPDEHLRHLNTSVSAVARAVPGPASRLSPPGPYPWSPSPSR